MPKQQVTKDDWIQAALTAVARGGIAAVRVDVLAKDLGITRGSFYWHFADREALLVAMLEWWERVLTTEIIERLEKVDSPLERYHDIVANAFFGRRDRNGIEPALAANADDPIVAPFLRRVTTARLRFLTQLFADLGLPEPAARQRALVTYGAFVGWLQLRHTSPDTVPELMATATEPMAEHLTSLLLADIDTQTTRAPGTGP
ncbi:TetR/AcrR family transcriptional regulator [Fodinicola acaciae]|uniref:TetR/AcrR family transcriptional regulator n=1 Tax=Fodinicola acaciae TaxID=2681555 RepID=UPI0013D41FF5|nr:TetR/AcrR family transcriptional regulator [Fodinicola acaciae]